MEFDAMHSGSIPESDSETGVSESDSNVHHSDGKDVGRTNKVRRYKCKPIIKPYKETKDEVSIEVIRVVGTNEDHVVQDGVMKTPPNITSSDCENVPLIVEREEDSALEPTPPQEHITTPEEERYNTRALSKQSTTYELEKFEKNAMIIFNQENVDGYEKREGTEQDVEALETTFTRFGFEVTEKKDLTKKVLLAELKAFCETDFTDYGCVAVAILTHGSKNGMLRARDESYCEKELLNHFMDKPMLVSKPILFIIQACRGKKQTAGAAVHMACRVQRDLDEEVEPYTLPVESDILILHSSYVGKPSHRDEHHGSWFIQSLCKKINQMADTHDVESILTEVKREVAIDRDHKEYKTTTMEMVTNKQMPVTTSTLIRKLFLKKIGDDEVYHRTMGNGRRESGNDVLDSGAPLLPFSRCSCFLSHFDYIRDCLSHFVEDHPNDTTAQGFLKVANTFKSDREFDITKKVMLREICVHLMTNAQNCSFYKYLHFYND